MILVSKDVNLRPKAKALGLISDDYYTDKIEDISKLYHVVRRFENIAMDIIDRLYKNRQVPAMFIRSIRRISIHDQPV